MTRPVDLSPGSVQIRRGVAVAAAVGVALCALAAWQTPLQFYQSYLWAFLSVATIGLGSAAVLMIYHLVGGPWGHAGRRIIEGGTASLLVLPVLAAPLVGGVSELYPWAGAESGSHDHLLSEKAAFLNRPFFFGRSAGYLVTWAVLAALLCGLSPVDQYASQRDADRRAAWLRHVSAAGLPLYGLTVSFASIDWMMSLEPHWYSAMYGMIVMAGQGVAGFSLALVFLAWATGTGDGKDKADDQGLQDLANLLLTAVCFWMYVTFAQYLIIWSGNLPEEITWYLARGSLGWRIIAGVLVAFQFIVPFVLLLSPRVKRNLTLLGSLAALLLATHLLELYWLIMPPLRQSPRAYWTDAVAVLTVTAIAFLVLHFYVYVVRTGIHFRPLQHAAHVLHE